MRKRERDHVVPSDTGVLHARVGQNEVTDTVVAPEQPDGQEEETERSLMVRIRAELAAMPGVLVWRNNTGMGTRLNGGEIGEAIRFGLAVGSADLVGIVRVRDIGVFAGFEVKLPRYRTRTTPEQKRWLDTVRRFGGIAAVVTSPEEARAVVERARL